MNSALYSLCPFIWLPFYSCFPHCIIITRIFSFLCVMLSSLPVLAYLTHHTYCIWYLFKSHSYTLESFPDRKKMPSFAWHYIKNHENHENVCACITTLIFSIICDILFPQGEITLGRRKMHLIHHRTWFWFYGDAKHDMFTNGNCIVITECVHKEKLYLWLWFLRASFVIEIVFHKSHTRSLYHLHYRIDSMSKILSKNVTFPTRQSCSKCLAFKVWM